MEQVIVDLEITRQNSHKAIKNLQHSSGLFSAAKKSVLTGYNLAWIRDNVYISLGLEAVNDVKSLKKLYGALLNTLLRHEYKIDHAIQKKPEHAFQYIHARYHPITLHEIHEPWGNKQNDAVGALLFKIGDLEEKRIKVLRDENDLRIVQKLVDYLNSVEYWHDKDNGMWEENEEVHASSVGACVAGLKKAKGIANVPEELIQKGEDALKVILPKESETKDVDMALLSLIYPYDIANGEQRIMILENIEKNLLREKGVIRYKGDIYYNKEGEAEWTMGLPWLAIIYKNLGLLNKHEFFLEKTFEAMNGNKELPELYFANSSEHNENSPLGWSQALFLVSLSQKVDIGAHKTKTLANSGTNYL